MLLRARHGIVLDVADSGPCAEGAGYVGARHTAPRVAPSFFRRRCRSAVQICFFSNDCRACPVPSPSQRRDAQRASARCASARAICLFRPAIRLARQRPAAAPPGAWFCAVVRHVCCCRACCHAMPEVLSRYATSVAPAAISFLLPSFFARPPSSFFPPGVRSIQQKCRSCVCGLARPYAPPRRLGSLRQHAQRLTTPTPTICVVRLF